jgi:hypothetical protein
VAFDRSPRWLRIAAMVFMAAAYAKFGWLAVQPNTYIQASAFAVAREGTIAISTHIPSYFTTIPASRFPASVDNADFSTAIAPDAENVGMPAPWTACAHFVASRTTDEIVLLWNDTPWALWHVFEARALGPNITGFCKE